MQDPFALLNSAVQQRVAVTLVDGELIEGRLISFDEKCNLALADAVRSAADEVTPVALKIVRGEMVSHVQVTTG